MDFSEYQNVRTAVDQGCWETCKEYLERVTRKDPEFRIFTDTEKELITAIIHKFKLIAELRRSGMFGQVAMGLYAHPDYPGLPVTPIAYIIPYHFPREGKGGMAVTDAPWDFYQPFVDRPSNEDWLKLYGLNFTHSRGYYAY